METWSNIYVHSCMQFFFLAPNRLQAMYASTFKTRYLTQLSLSSLKILQELSWVMSNSLELNSFAAISATM
jgi:hypothetical protein